MKPSWKAFFERYGDYTPLATFYEMRSEFTVEELYQAFKERLAAEADPCACPDGFCAADMGDCRLPDLPGCRKHSG